MPMRRRLVGGCPSQNIPNSNPIIQNWITAVTTPPTGLPGATSTSLSVNVVSTPAGAPTQNAVTITECWQGPNDHGLRTFVTTIYVDY